MTKRELFAALKDVPDDALVRTSDDLNITGIEVDTHILHSQQGAHTLVWMVYLEDDGDAEA